ncbi:sensor histidine kinase [Microcoleus sp. FACHB-1515]|uniref:ATP-binding protein n=1 Tax=Cyanophyceae TaxID=3028117 RepID=UPI00168878C8|nr:ATP-binding protein [Microcoleus sp. FACHB-1515]MBD2088688.1 sensor histidine kinase [Microcoleus sp. FACHB-1515]
MPFFQFTALFSTAAAWLDGQRWQFGDRLSETQNSRDNWHERNGLAIVRHIVELHGGRISVASIEPQFHSSHRPDCLCV